MFCLTLIIDFLITALIRLGSDKESATNSHSGAEEVDGDEDWITDDEELITNNEGLITNDEELITDDDEWVTDDEQEVTDDEELITDDDEWVTDDEERMTSLFGRLPTWESNLINNFRRSRLIGLPDEILLMIMKQAELSDLYMLRQVSYTFWRLYLDRTFDKLNSSNIFASSSLTKNDAVIKVAQERAFCSLCLAMRKSPDFKQRQTRLMDSLFCSYCNKDHPRLQFSPLERDDHVPRRFCRLYEGLVQICMHKTITLDRLAWDSSQATINRLLSEGQKDAFTTRCLETCSTCEKICRKSSMKGMKPPSVDVEFFSFIKDGVKHLSRSYSVSWKFPLMKITDEQPFTDTVLTAKFKELQGKFGRLLCPHMNFDRLVAAFDPSVCSWMAGHSRPYPSGGLENMFWWTCAQLRLYNDSGQSLRGSPCRKSSALFHATKHMKACPTCRSLYLWNLEDDTLYLSRGRGNFIPRSQDIDGWKSTPHVLGVLAAEPTSFEPKTDYEAKHILWCDDLNCKNGRNMERYVQKLRDLSVC